MAAGMPKAASVGGPSSWAGKVEVGKSTWTSFLVLEGKGTLVLGEVPE